MATPWQDTRHKTLGLVHDPDYKHFAINGGKPSDEILDELRSCITACGAIYDLENAYDTSLYRTNAGQKDEDDDQLDDDLPGIR